MARLTARKLEQAGDLVKTAGVDVWLTFVRETAEGSDPVLPFLIEGGLTWQSALLIDRTGRRVAIVGNYDADPLRASGDWDEVIPYVKGIRELLLETLERLIPASAERPRIAINWSLDDPKADGITHGMKLQLDEILSGTRFAGCCISGEAIVGGVRSRKIPDEIERVRRAISSTMEILHEIPQIARVGQTERQVYDQIQQLVIDRGLGFSWDRQGDPIVNSGPDSMIGHGIPSETIRIAPGHIFHIDLGVVCDGYASDLQRSWFVGEADARGHADTHDPPEEVTRAFRAVHGAISEAAAVLHPGVEGWCVDDVARRFITSAGYPEYQHALGHQVGRMAHDGGALLGPRWERYGKTPCLPVEPNQVYTLELGVLVDGRGYLGIEEMVLITDTGCAWLSERQSAMPILR